MAAFMSQAAEEAADFARGLTSKQGWRRRAVLEAQSRGFLSRPSMALAPEFCVSGVAIGGRAAGWGWSKEKEHLASLLDNNVS